MDNSATGISGTWSNRSEEVDFNLSIISFIEDGTYIVYCPALEVSGYGNSENEAKDSFQISLSEFLSYTLKKKTLFNELKELGWNVSNKKHKAISPPDMTTLLNNNENFSNIFNNNSFHKYDTQISIPV